MLLAIEFFGGMVDMVTCQQAIGMGLKHLKILFDKFVDPTTEEDCI